MRVQAATRTYTDKLHPAAGDPRELDAGVRKGNRLILFECVSIERPLDYEISNPRKIARRISRLDVKVTQAITLQQFVENNRRGRNYDFSWAEETLAFVLSPFVEWTRNRSDRLWVGDTP
jgi:hypothetical protein